MDELTDSQSTFPSIENLAAGLTTVFNSNGSRLGRATVLHREATPYSTTFPCEIVTCRLEQGGQLALFCKYTGGIDYTGHGHRGGVEYETAVYRQVLSAMDLSQPKFYGGYS